MPDGCSPASTSNRSRWPRAALTGAVALVLVFAAAVLGMWGGLALVVGRRAEPLWSERGVSLGMSEEQVEHAFADRASGDWSRTAGCGGVALEWRRTEACASARWARFEFHEGVLVAIRLHSDDAAAPEHAEQTSTAVRQRRPFEGGTATTILSRTCLTHTAEAEQIALAATRDLPR